MRQVLGVIGFVAMVAACGQPAPVTVKLAEPRPKEIVVGQGGHYVLDRKESSAVIRSGTLDIKVTGVTETDVALEGKASVKTLVGPKAFTLASSIESGIMTREWLAQLREVKTYREKNALISYEGLTADACDRVKLSDIVGYPNLAIEPTVCLQNRTIPSVAVFIKEGGQVFTAFFRADE